MRKKTSWDTRYHETQDIMRHMTSWDTRHHESKDIMRHETSWDTRYHETQDIMRHKNVMRHETSWEKRHHETQVVECERSKTLQLPFVVKDVYLEHVLRLAHGIIWILYNRCSQIEGSTATGLLDTAVGPLASPSPVGLGYRYESSWVARDSSDTRTREV